MVLENQDAAMYMASDLSKLLSDIYYFPLSTRLRQKTKDEVYAIQRTELISRLSGNDKPCIIVTYPEALAEPIPEKSLLEQNIVRFKVGEHINLDSLIKKLLEFDFNRVDFVYEPGQFAIRGGIVDIFSYSRENPYRLDFFGDDIDTIRVFDIETQLSKERVESADIVPAFDDSKEAEMGTLMDYLPTDTILVSNDFSLARYKLADTKISFTEYPTLELRERASEMFSNVQTCTFKTMPQPIFHKNFDLLMDSVDQFIADDYHIYIASDSVKQTDRIKAILDSKFEERNTSGDSLPKFFTAIDSTIHEGFVDHEGKLVLLTDHQIFERYHRVQAKEEAARRGKAVITLKELNQLQLGDYVVHTDHGIGKFGGLVTTTANGKPQEVIKLIYRDNDVLFVSIHNLHKISKYRGKEGNIPNISKLGSGAWERIKDRTKSKVKDIARDLIRLYAERKQEKGFAYSPDSYMQHELEASFLYEDTPDQAKATIELKHDMESPRPMDRLICGDVGFGKTELAMRAAFKAATDGKQVAVLVPTTVLALQHYNTFKERFNDFPVKVEYLSRGKSAKDVKAILEDLKNGKIDIIIGTHKLVGKTVAFKDLGLLIIDEEQKFGVATKERLKQLRANIDVLTLTATPIPRTLQFSLLGARDLSIMTTPPPNRYPVQTEIISSDDEDIIREAIELEMGRNGQIFVINNLVQNLSTIANKIHRLVPQARIAIAHGQMPTDEMESVLTDFINYDYDILVATSIVESGVDITNVNTIIIFSAQKFGLSDLHQLRGRVGRSNRKAYCYLVAPASELLTEDARRRLQAVETFAELGSGFHIAMQDLDIRGAGNMLGAEQSGFIADLGYETYQRILNEAVLELKNDEFADVFADEDEPIELGTDSQGVACRNWVSDSQIDTDLSVAFPSDYIENISERITLYRELDSLQNERELVDYKKRLIDRFGIIPNEGEELLNVVRLRWLCMRLGIERLVLKQERLLIYFPIDNNNSYYQSNEFGKIIQYVCNKPKRCQLKEGNNKRYIIISEVRTIQGAFNLLTKILEG